MDTRDNVFDPVEYITNSALAVILSGLLLVTFTSNVYKTAVFADR